MYSGGIRVVDISGDLMGDLYKQGREIGYILPGDKDGYIPFATMSVSYTHLTLPTISSV